MKILVVEDNQYVAKALNLILGDRNYVVEIASDGEEAWGFIKLFDYDPRSYEVTYNKQLLALTPKEYALLELFLRNTHHVFSCSTILDHLWSYEDAPTEEAVRTHIKGLRMKLKAAGVPSNIIETVQGIGYRLNPQVEEEAKEIPLEK